MTDALNPTVALDAYPTAKPGEPTFTLQGGDPFAPGCVLEWAKRARAYGFTLPEDSAEREDLLLRATNAEQVAWEMQAYQRGQPADSNTGEAMAQGYAHTAMIGAGTSETKARLVRSRQLTAASNSLDNAVAILTDLGFEALPETLKNLSAEILASRNTP
jgi:hypothetical protein